MDQQEKKKLAEILEGRIDSGEAPDKLKNIMKEKGWSDDEVAEVFSVIQLNQDKQEAVAESDAISGGSEFSSDSTESTANQSGQGSGGSEDVNMTIPPHPSYAHDQNETQQANQDDQQQSQGTKDQVMQGGHENGAQLQGAESLKQDDSSLSSLVVGVVVTLLLLAVAGGAVAYVQLSGGSTAERPNLASIYKAHQSVDSVRYDVSSDFNFDLNTSELKTRDDFDRLKKILPYVPNTGDIGEVPGQLQLAFSVGGAVNFAETNSDGKTDITLAVGSSETEDIVDIDVRYTDKVGYVKAKSLPSVPMMPVESFQGQWFSFSPTSTPGQVNSAQSVFRDADISTDTVIQIAKAAQSTGLISLEGITADGLDDGPDTFKYSLNMHPRNLPQFKSEFQTIIEENNPKLADEEQFKTYLDEPLFEESDRELPKKIGPINVWVARNSNRLRKVAFNNTYTREDIKRKSSSNGERDLTGLKAITVSLGLDLSDYNQSISVVKPKSSTPIKEAMQSLPFFGGMSSARKSSRDARRQTDLQQIKTALALYYNESGTYPPSLYSGSESLADSGNMTQVPTDPDDDSQYYYTKQTSAGEFCLGASMEDAEVPDNNSQECIADLIESGAPDDINYAISG